jgi:hypothetical protein
MEIPENILNELSKRTYDDITSFYIHHGDNSPSESLVEASVEEVNNPSQGFLVLGYNVVIRLNGETWQIEEARPLLDVPAAQENENTVGYALCVFGNYEDNAVPEAVIPLIIERIEQVKSKCKNLKFLQGHRDAAVVSHDPSVATACPGTHLYSLLPMLREHTGLGNIL